MSNESITVLIVAVSAVAATAAWIGLVVVPAWSAYSRWYERAMATFLSLYVLAACVLGGVGVGAGVVWFWDRV